MVMCPCLTRTQTPFLAILYFTCFWSGSKSCWLCVRRTPHPVIVTIRDTSNYIRVLLYSYYTTITGWGVHLSYVLITEQQLGY